ncbi:hypothetical protein GYH30_017760 [Glycine max]|uniref:Uncharacterized protein n=1 Tax=Glycine max TaxID=3847 RepID=I1KIL3_SOYBN|nr:hypothetical protein GYH30_017760 [Glycine max]
MFSLLFFPYFFSVTTVIRVSLAPRWNLEVSPQALVFGLTMGLMFNPGLVIIILCLYWSLFTVFSSLASLILCLV